MPVDEIHITKASELTSDTGQTGGMVRKGAVYGLSDKLNANVMIAQPHTSSEVHHHADEDTIVYGQSGHGAIVYNNGKDKKPLGPGDFCLIPAGVEHQEVNDSDEEVVWVIVRSGKQPAVENLKGWGESQKKIA